MNLIFIVFFIPSMCQSSSLCSPPAARSWTPLISAHRQNVTLCFWRCKLQFWWIVALHCFFPVNWIANWGRVVFPRVRILQTDGNIHMHEMHTRPHCTPPQEVDLNQFDCGGGLWGREREEKKGTGTLKGGRMRAAAKWGKTFLSPAGFK